MKKTIIFYTDEELKEMKKALNSSKNTVNSIASAIIDKPIFANRTFRSLEQRMLKLSKEMNRPTKANPKCRVIKERKSSYFYQQYEIEEMIDLLSTTRRSIRSLADELAIKYGRNNQALAGKIFHLSKNVVRPEREKNMSDVVSKEKVKTVPKTLGIDVPEGTSFDIQNVKRVVLQKKSLTIYF
jgi:hypothetical protein